MGGQDGSDPRSPHAAAPQLRLDELLDELQKHVQLVRGTRDRVQTLLDAVLAIGSDLDLDVVLRRIVASAVDLVDARYGALGILGEEDSIRQFITVGMDEETIARIGHYPQGHGILGLLIREPAPLRLADLTQHADSVGFPPGHPPMHTFLGAPVRIRDHVFGNLYLTDKRDGQQFDADDEAVLRTLAAAAGVAIDNARLYQDARRRQRWLAASADLNSSLLSGTDPGQVLYTLAETVREMAEADLVTLAVPVHGTKDLVVEAAAGPHADTVHGLALPAGTLAAKVYRTGEPVTSDGLSADPRSEGGSASLVELGPAFFVPLGAGDAIRGVLQVARTPAGQPFSDTILEVISGFAGQAALALQIAEHRREAEQVLVLNDRDRIARDLHDLAIQRLFASGLSLQATLGRLADRPETAERIQRVVEDLDETIRTIRSTIYSLHQRDRGEGAGLRARLLAEIDRATEPLGFTPALRMTGLLDTLVPRDMAEHLLAALREALSNAARHAHATAVEVAAEVGATAVRLRVTDNGGGIDPATSRRSGLANLRARAEQLGGTFTVAPREPAGTVLEWSAPLPTGN
ncbi:sensor histidine kinase [Streptacidiphilus griseoplanus]|uniref:sensor histidine kinase n=1 Tax=Peterkaempfera griseoplana TaxID=66896 RepID=UPI0006E2B258|nr:GAF domain-containing sensor histidine kinase [Peterkaempfera griseoplana]